MGVLTVIMGSSEILASTDTRGWPHRHICTWFELCTGHIMGNGMYFLNVKTLAVDDALHVNAAQRLVGCHDDN